MNTNKRISLELVKEWNKKLSDCSAAEILEWAKVTFQSRLFQTTSFGLTGLATIEMLNHDPVPIIFIDTLHNFEETLDLINRITKKYDVQVIRVYPKDATSKEDFERIYGENLWTTNPSKYDYLVKAEPAYRIYRELGVEAILTGRRRSQGADRENLNIVEYEESTGIVKINAFYSWTYDQVFAYVKDHNVPYNILHEQGYKSIGDRHSTEKTLPGENERDGRWRGQEKTECGLHKDYFIMKRLAKLYK